MISFDGLWPRSLSLLFFHYHYLHLCLSRFPEWSRNSSYKDPLRMGLRARPYWAWTCLRPHQSSILVILFYDTWVIYSYLTELFSSCHSFKNTVLAKCVYLYVFACMLMCASLYVINTCVCMIIKSLSSHLPIYTTLRNPSYTCTPVLNNIDPKAYCEVGWRYSLEGETFGRCVEVPKTQVRALWGIRRVVKVSFRSKGSRSTLALYT